MEREHYIVNGLGNENIKTQVKNALEKIDGVNKVCVDLGRGSVEIIYNEPAKKLHRKYWTLYRIRIYKEVTL